MGKISDLPPQHVDKENIWVSDGQRKEPIRLSEIIDFVAAEALKKVEAKLDKRKIEGEL